MNKIKYRKVLYSTVASLTLQPLTSASAQQTESGGSEAGALEEVLVTAQRRSERALDVPMSISVVSADLLEHASVTNIHELGQIVAGAKINYAGTFTQPSIRGVTSLINGVGVENNVAIYIDGFYVPDTLSINTDLANIQSIEVLKGPQGTLWGRNATGGAILINTLAPADELTGNFKASFARYDDISVGGYLSGPITDGIRFSITGHRRESDGYIKLIDPAGTGSAVGYAAPQKQESVRIKLEGDIAESLTATLAYNYALSEDPKGLMFSTFQYARATIPAPPFRAVEPNTASFNSETQNHVSTDEYTLTLKYEMSLGSLTSYTGYAERGTRVLYDFDGTYGSFFSARDFYSQETFQQSIDFVIDAPERYDVLVGATYYDDNLTTDGRNSYSTQLDNTIYNTLKAEAYALYGQVTWAFTESLSLNIGSRYNSEKKSIAYRQLTPAGVNVVPPASKDKTFDGVTFNTSLTYELTPDTNVYAAFSQGYRSGAFNTTPVSSPSLLIPIDPEEIDAYEIGLKTEGKTLRFDIAAFFYDYTDLQVGVVLPNPNGVGLINLQSNAKKAEMYGADAQLTITPVSTLNITAGVAYLHGRYKDFPNAVGTGLNTSTMLNVSGQQQNWSDKETARSPEFSGFLNLVYTIPVAVGSLQLSGNMDYTDSYVISNPSLYGPLAGSLAGEQRLRQSAHTLVGAQVSWIDPSDQFTVAVFGKNLTNEDYLIAYNAGFYGDYRTFGQPISFGIRVGYQF